MHLHTSICVSPFYIAHTRVDPCVTPREQFKEDEELPRDAATSGMSAVEKRKYEAGVAALKLVQNQR